MPPGTTEVNVQLTNFIDDSLGVLIAMASLPLRCLKSPLYPRLCYCLPGLDTVVLAERMDDNQPPYILLLVECRAPNDR